MITLQCVYIKVNDMNKAIEFYKDLLQSEIEYRNEDRWVNFKFKNGFSLALYNVNYDLKKLEQGDDTKNHYSDNYISELRKSKTTIGNSIVLNFQVEDLRSEYERIKNIEHGQVSEIMYINLVTPYYYFNVEDPDGNTLEITGNYK
ncbi:MAG: VOC family protein [Candidatus Delongbacteria bacterium]|nr:VOC family protein [Candidatus Delongbacteria bacterium]